MVQLFTALFVLGHFIAGLPTPADIQAQPKAVIVQMYSSSCVNYFKSPAFSGVDISSVLQNLFTTLNAKPDGQMRWLEGKGNTRAVIEFYNKVCNPNPDLKALDGFESALTLAAQEYQRMVSQLPPMGDLRQKSLSQATDLLSSDGKVIADISMPEGRRKVISLEQLPPYLPQILMAVEDSRFFEHKGVDELGILRAVMKDVTKNGARQGASTITQQVARNLFLSSAQTTKRKLQEILIAEQIEIQLSKKEILNLYFNLIYFGRNSYGIEKAARSYFGKSADKLTLTESIFLVGIIHGPNIYRNQPSRIETRMKFVVERLKEKALVPSNFELNLAKNLNIFPDVDPYNANYFRDFASEKIRKLNPAWMSGGTQIKTSIDSRLQMWANEALQDGLINYERKYGSGVWSGPLVNIADYVTLNFLKNELVKSERRLTLEKSEQSLFSAMKSKTLSPSKAQEPTGTEKPWLAPLNDFGTKYRVPNSKWRLAILTANNGSIGLNDGSEGQLAPQSLKWAASFGRGLKKGDVFYARRLNRNFWEIVQTPEINGAVIMMEPSGRILALVGGFNYSLSNWNRATNALRQPGSLMKPFTYLAALQKGLQPNVLLKDSNLYFPPASPGGRPWIPINYGKDAGGPRPMRWALENSRNVMTAHLMSQIGLEPVRNLAEKFGLYEKTINEYPFILGAQETTLLSLVKAYAEIDNGGYEISPHVIEQVTDANNSTNDFKPSYGHKISDVDDISLFQLRYLMQGVVERGTAASLKKYSGFLAGKTGTTNDSRDVWFIGYTPDVVIGVYVGFDKPKDLGNNATGGAIALPVFDRILSEMLKNNYVPTSWPPAPDGVVFLPTNRFTGEIVSAPTSNTVFEAYRESSVTDKIPTTMDSR